MHLVSNVVSQRGWAWSLFCCAAAMAAACGGSSSNDWNENTGLDAGSASDGDSDVDSDTDTDSDSDGDSDGWDEDDAGTVEIRDGGVLIEDEDGTTFVCYETICDGRLLACGDCQDNDNDGKTDWRDRECLGPCDNTEGPALIPDVGGVIGETCHVDCYFDYGNGMGPGTDDCWWDHQCDPLEPEPDRCPFSQSVVNNQHFCPDEQSAQCDQICLPFTPNGCDCFGCCTAPELAGLGPEGSDAHVWIGAVDAENQGTCTFDDLLDPVKCPRCTPVGNCYNDCGKCEICMGKPTIPPDCFDDPDGPADGQCPEGVQPCGLPTLPPCDQGYYCVSGCCQSTVDIE